MIRLALALVALSACTPAGPDAGHGVDPHAVEADVHAAQEHGDAHDEADHGDAPGDDAHALAEAPDEHGAPADHGEEPDAHEALDGEPAEDEDWADEVVPEDAAAVVLPVDEAQLRGLVNAVLFRLALALVALFAIRSAARWAAGRYAHLARELALARFGGTVVVLLMGTGSLASVAQVGGTPVVLGGLVTATVIGAGLAVLWAPRYLDGLWVALRASYEGSGRVEAGGVLGQLSDVGLLRVRLHHDDGHWTSVPIWSLGGSPVRGDDHHTFPVVVRVADPGKLDAVYRAAVLSPFRDPAHPVEVVHDDHGAVVRASAWGEEAADRLGEAMAAGCAG